MDIMVIVYAILAYLIGSIPSGLIIGKTFFNTDVRQYGSKNIGATNTYRVIGLKAALPVFLCDALKGAAGVILLSSYGPMYMILGGILGMMGHNWSVFGLKVVGRCYGFRCTYCSFTNIKLICFWYGVLSYTSLTCIFRALSLPLH
ncbi:MAG: glycerol-3-phosphate acyltransferase [Veillonella sp.]